MTLRVRLTLYFTLIVVVPLAVAAVTARVVLVRELERRAGEELDLGLFAVSEQVELMRLRAGDLAEDLAAPERDLGTALDAGDTAALEQVVSSALGERGRVDLVVFADPIGGLLAGRATPADLPPGTTEPRLDDLAEQAAAGTVPPAVLGEVRRLEDARGRVLGAILVGRWVDETLAEGLRGALPVDVTLFVGADAVASTDPGLELTAPSEDPEQHVETADRPAIARSLDLGDWTVVVSRQTGSLATARSIITIAMVGVLVAAALAAALLGWLLAQVVVHPVRELADAARDVAGGDLDRRISVEGGDELATLGAAFNTMTENLRRQVGELQRSRDALQRSLDRLGQTLSSTLDLNRTLTAVVEAGMTALGAERAALYMLAPGRTWLYTKVARGLSRDLIDRRVGVGEGLVGWVAQTGSTAHLPNGGGTPRPGPDEPHADAIVAVPLFSPNSGSVIGVLALYGPSAGEMFRESDVHTLRSFAVQASVAIENVRLHEATQQASITDSLTGLWNLRYFQQRVEEEIERATRFGHTLTMAILDIDRFKLVNDEYGHLVGDEVLVEVARRVSGEIREVDTLARYGGEEFVLVLPETDLLGARATAERIREAIATTPIVAEHGPGGRVELHITASLGVATFPDHGRTADGLLRSADQAMYAAKRAGRNRVEVAVDTPVSGGP